MSKKNLFYIRNFEKDWDNLKGIKRVCDEIMERKAIAEEIIVNKIHKHGMISGVSL